MIKNTSETLNRSIPEAEETLRKIMDEIIKQEKEGTVTINTVEKLIGEAIEQFTNIVLGMSGQLLSNIEVEKKR
jgi:ribosomal protein S3AE